MDGYLASLSTEQINEETRNIDTCSTEEMVRMINRQDALVAGAVARETEHIAAAIDLIWPRLREGGRLIYLGAGTSGRLGVLDASECLPTFGVDPDMVQGYIAGGDTALRHPVEGCEDSEEEGVRLIEELQVGPKDAVVGITASGGAPYVLAALRRARERGAAVIGLCTNAHSKLEGLCDVCIAPEVGPEVISGSTRMKSGTAQKMVLNMLTTCSMVKLGKVYGNLMVDLKASNKKLEDRARRLIIHATGARPDQAADYLQRAGGHVKLAILMLESSLEAPEAQALLDRCEGRLALAIQAAKEGER
ncbi:N-acetylmuramic acid 6-phosphate etherase [uncultured Intestinimonas sp.]|uniref:N-acetylmuramic acid 6-phosphate etherase n=1 Tax=uncultured Intestinimonas sp. TaxID=1689265 RepID=UPI0025EBD866|nr:N-acetylmuramic acid 6-phosphate etherase [uncultured Intestinimonas sp.]